jgi:hypothetical protein
MCSQLRHTVAYLGAYNALRCILVFVSNLHDSIKGPPATFTHQASRSRFGINANYVQCERINDVFTAVEKVHLIFLCKIFILHAARISLRFTTLRLASCGDGPVSNGEKLGVRKC